MIKVKRIENEEIMMAMTMTKIIITTVIMKIIIIIMMIMRNKIGIQIKNIKTFRQNKNCSSKTNSYLL